MNSANKTDKQYEVILTGDTLSGHDPEDVAVSLAGLFHSTPQKMSSLLQGDVTPLKKHYIEEDAREIRDAIRNTGAGCSISLVDELDEDELDEDELGGEVETEPGSSTFNPKEGQILNADEDSSVSRGDSVEPGAGEIHRRQGQEGESETENYSESVNSSERDSSDRNSVYWDQVSNFIETNTSYYLRQFKRFGELQKISFTPTWHWPAFLGFFFWALYRKLWRLAGINLIGGFVLGFLFDSNLLFLLWSFFWAMSANFLYLKEVRRYVPYPPVESPGPPDQQYGGVSKVALWLGAVFAVIFMFSSIQYMSAQFMDKYGDEINEILPGSGSLTRGDGSTLNQTDEEDPVIAKTVVSLRVLATSIKMLMLGKASEKDGTFDTNEIQSVEMFVEKIKDKAVKDSWGVEIRLEHRGDHYVIISAGPDQIFSTHDDLVQQVTLSTGN
ncbi:MAG: hypothetical protein GKR95_21685 [Gammaproteobacteria bacterium]|nr:hypothetical protein [Gammaproteobacteria bacterium]